MYTPSPPLNIRPASHLFLTIRLFGDGGLTQAPRQKLTPIKMARALACSSESPASSNPLQNQEGTLGYLGASDHLVGWHSAHLQGQFLTFLNIPDYDAELFLKSFFFSELSWEVFRIIVSPSFIHFFISVLN